jgi:hypothetical protein
MRPAGGGGRFDSRWHCRAPSLRGGRRWTEPPWMMGAAWTAAMAHPQPEAPRRRVCSVTTAREFGTFPPDPTTGLSMVAPEMGAGTHAT